MRSHTATKGIERAPHRSLFKAMGYTDREINRPHIGIAMNHKGMHYSLASRELIADSIEEIDKRFSKWEKPEQKIKTGYMARYAKMVSSAGNGAIFKNNFKGVKR